MDDFEVITTNMRVTHRELDAAYDAGSEDGAFTPERWRDGKPRETYLEAWNRANPDDQRTLDPSESWLARHPG